MPHADRFTVSLDTELLAAFDHHIAMRGYTNRSEAIRDLIRDLLLANRSQVGDQQVAAVLTLVCDHSVREAGSRLRTCLSQHGDLVAGSLHVDIDADRESVAVSLRGTADRVQAVADRIQAMRGISHGRFSAVPIEAPRTASATSTQA